MNRLLVTIMAALFLCTATLSGVFSVDCCSLDALRTMRCADGSCCMAHRCSCNDRCLNRHENMEGCPCVKCSTSFPVAELPADEFVQAHHQVSDLPPEVIDVKMLLKQSRSAPEALLLIPLEPASLILKTCSFLS
jgi:hypothetical protein